jgi:hypothetical protein
MIGTGFMTLTQLFLDELIVRRLTRRAPDTPR